jgi:hypothetical protein
LKHIHPSIGVEVNALGHMRDSDDPEKEEYNCGNATLAKFHGSPTPRE